MARTKQTPRKNKQPKDSSTVNPLKRKADTIEEAETRQDVLDSRTNAVGRKRNKTDGNEILRPLIIDNVPKGLRKLVKLEMDRGPGSLIDALARCSEPYKANCKQFKKLHAQYTSEVSEQPAEEVESASDYSEGDMDIDSDSDSVDLASLGNSGEAEFGDRLRRGSHHEHNLRERRPKAALEANVELTTKNKDEIQEQDFLDIELAEIEPVQLRGSVQQLAARESITNIQSLKLHFKHGMPHRKAAVKIHEIWQSKLQNAQQALESDDDDAVSVGAVGEHTPTPEPGAEPPEIPLDPTSKQMRKYIKKKAKRRDVELADIQPLPLRRLVQTEVSTVHCSVMDALSLCAQNGRPYRKPAMFLHEKWSAGVALRQAQEAGSKVEQPAIAGHLYLDDEMSVGEVSPAVETSDGAQVHQQASSPDEGQVSEGSAGVQDGARVEDVASVGDMVRVGDLDEQDQRLQAKYFMLTDPDAYCLCLSCGDAGHEEATCPANVCAHCGSVGAHFAAACPAYRKCGKCRQRGHDTAHCTRRAVQGGGADDPCNVCAHTGHVEEECADLWRTIGTVDAQRQVTRIAAPSMRKAYILKKTGDRGTWSAQHAGKYVLDDQEIEEQPAYGRPAPAAYYPQSYQLAALDY
ncbi:hypothetical protein LTR10_003855 [Elasticomyces elasticus]|nr:hypothetical protein LTR10_003855 [Elasticomyces elasticus]KAK4977959.1 hypothetical protein LTR42_002334 [Elasticomyces elasticus]